MKYLEDINLSVKKEKGFRYGKKKNDNVEKSVKLTIYESDKEFKRRFQAASKEEQAKMGYDAPRHAEDDDFEIVRLANEWLRDGQPVN